jgi:hypothetical protein
MYGVSFRLPEKVATAEKQAKSGAEGAGEGIYEEFEDKGRMKMAKK